MALGLPHGYGVMVHSLHLHRSANESKFGMGGRFENGLPARRIFPG